jgi:hypothetical protein
MKLQYLCICWKYVCSYATSNSFEEQSERNVALFLSAVVISVNAGFVCARELGTISHLCQSTNDYTREEDDIWPPFVTATFQSVKRDSSHGFCPEEGPRFAGPIDRLYSPPALDPPHACVRTFCSTFALNAMERKSSTTLLIRHCVFFGGR